MEWIKIKYYENYSININGEVRNDKRDRILKWLLNSSGYYYVHLCKNGKRTDHYIHRLIALHFIPNPKNYLQIDHVNNDKTDNSITNLRWCDNSQNCRNKKKREGATSNFRGVSLIKSNKKWFAKCSLNGKQKYLGSYETEIEAAQAYDDFIIKNNLQEFAVLNNLNPSLHK